MYIYIYTRVCVCNKALKCSWKSLLTCKNIFNNSDDKNIYLINCKNIYVLACIKTWLFMKQVIVFLDEYYKENFLYVTMEKNTSKQWWWVNNLLILKLN